MTVLNQKVTKPYAQSVNSTKYFVVAVPSVARDLRLTTLTAGNVHFAETTPITIKIMNPEIKAKWVAALRSGKYKQGQGELRDGKKFCCLGVLCDIHAKTNRGKWSAAGTYHGEDLVLPVDVRKWAGLKEQNPILTGPSLTTLAEENDAGKTFTEIASLIKKHL